MLFKNLFFVFLCILWTMSSHAFDQHKFIKSFEDKVHRVHKHYRVPGFAVVVVKDNEIIYLKGIGKRNIKEKAEVDENTIFQIGSLTKSFTSVASAHLVSEKRLDWDDKVIQYDPEFKLADDQHTQNLTISHILSHRSGLPAHAGDALIQSGKYYKDVIGTLDDFQKLSPLGTHYSYQNVLLCLLDPIIDNVVDHDWRDFFQSRIFGPLEMKRTSFGVDALQEADNVASSHVATKKGMSTRPWSRFGERIALAGGINTTARDMANYLKFHINEGEYKDRKLLPQAIYKQLGAKHEADNIKQLQRKRRISYPTSRVKNVDYGYGLYLYDWAGEDVIGHSGMVSGQNAIFAVLPKQKIGIAILNNAATKLPTILRSYFLDLATGVRPIDWLNRVHISKLRKTRATRKNHVRAKRHIKKRINKRSIKKRPGKRRRPARARKK
jgi:beta-lactamase class C